MEQVARDIIESEADSDRDSSDDSESEASGLESESSATSSDEADVADVEEPVQKAARIVPSFDTVHEYAGENTLHDEWTAVTYVAATFGWNGKRTMQKVNAMQQHIENLITAARENEDSASVALFIEYLHLMDEGKAGKTVQSQQFTRRAPK